VQTLNGQKNERTTSQRFGKIKRGATHRTKPTLCTTFAVAPTEQKRIFVA